jgi:hypothetical protein
MKEPRQLNERTVFRPIGIIAMTHQEKRRAIDSLIFLAEKRDGRIKVRTCANERHREVTLLKEDPTNCTMLTEEMLTTRAIEANQQRDIMTVDKSYKL